jgi:hypothetical protein
LNLSELFLAHDADALFPLILGIPNLVMGIAFLSNAVLSAWDWASAGIPGA